MEDHYTVLGVTRDADPATIKRQYRRLALKLHPDRRAAAAAAPAADAADATRTRFLRVQEAYRVLSNSDLRRAYDAERAGGGHRYGCDQRKEARHAVG